MSTNSLFCLEYVENASLAKFQPSRRAIQALKRTRVRLRSILLRPLRIQAFVSSKIITYFRTGTPPALVKSDSLLGFCDLGSYRHYYISYIQNYQIRAVYPGYFESH